MTLLLDASVWLAAVDREDRAYEDARGLLERAPDVAAIELTRHEVVNVAVRSWRSLEDARLLLGLITRVAGDAVVGLSVTAHEDAAALAHELGLSAYDAAYVAVARERGWRLVSLDVRDLVRPGHAVLPSAALADFGA